MSRPARTGTDVAALVVTRDRLETLRECIDAVRAQTAPVASIVVVDNGSSDGTGDWLAQQDDIDVVSQGDEGLAGGLYSGFAHALAGGYSFVWTLDDDAVPHPDALERLLASPALDGATVAGSLVVSKDDPAKLSFHVPLVTSYSRLLDYHWRTTDDVATVRAASDELGYPWGMFVNSVLFPREVVERIGLPKREFYMGGEEIEYFYRVRSHGFRTYLVLDSLCRHPKRASKDVPKWRARSLARNMSFIHRTYRRWWPLRTAWRSLRLVLTGGPGMLRPVLDGIREDFSRRY